MSHSPQQEVTSSSQIHTHKSPSPSAAQQLIHQTTTSYTQHIRSELKEVSQQQQRLCQLEECANDAQLVSEEMVNPLDVSCISVLARERSKIMGCFMMGEWVGVRLRYAWTKISIRSQYKDKMLLAVFRIFNYTHKVAKQRFFISLKRYPKEQPTQLHHPSTQLDSSFQTLNEQKADQLYKIIKQQFNSSRIANRKTNTNTFTNTNTNTFINAISQNEHRVKLQLQNKMLEAQIRELRENVEMLSKRLERQNQKKKQSLKMLAEELEEKNQLISDLRRSLSFYEAKYPSQNNILDTDLQSIRKQYENSQRIRHRLENDLQSTKNKLSQASQKLAQANQKITSLESAYNEHKSLVFDNKLKSERLEKVTIKLQKLIETFQSKLKQFNYFNDCSKMKSLEAFQQAKAGLKLSVLIEYLGGLCLEEMGKCSLFNAEELKILGRLSQEWRMLKSKTDKNRSDSVKQCDVSGIMGQGGLHKNDHSIFQMLDSPKTETVRPQNKVTMKIMQIELQKNRLSGQISELKSKILHIRDIVLNLLKTIQIDGKKAQTTSVLELIMQIFEYSEQQRIGIFSKKKKIFGIF